jgi:hypothetical protein
MPVDRRCRQGFGYITRQMSVVRTLVLWLSLLSIPVQGMAAVVMPLCPIAPSSGMSVDVDRPAVHIGAIGSTSATADHTMHHGAVSPGLADAGHDGSASPSGHGMHKSCSASCAMVTVATPSAIPRTPVPSLAPLQPAVQIYAGVTLDGLDRPPKHLLA